MKSKPLSKEAREYIKHLKSLRFGGQVMAVINNQRYIVYSIDSVTHNPLTIRIVMTVNGDMSDSEVEKLLLSDNAIATFINCGHRFGKHTFHILNAKPLFRKHKGTDHKYKEWQLTMVRMYANARIRNIETNTTYKLIDRTDECGKPISKVLVPVEKK